MNINQNIIVCYNDVSNGSPLRYLNVYMIAYVWQAPNFIVPGSEEN